MAKKSVPLPKYLRQRLIYNPTNGELVWKQRPVSEFSSAGEHAIRLCKAWNTRCAGKLAGQVSGDRRRITIDGNSYISARVAWAINTGEWPAGDIDHINGNALDDSASNLRDVDRALNNRNRAPSDSKPVGVTERANNCWEARMSVNNRTVRIGYFKTEAEAVSARVEAGQRHGFTDRHYGR